MPTLASKRTWAYAPPCAEAAVKNAEAAAIVARLKERRAIYFPNGVR